MSAKYFSIQVFACVGFEVAGDHQRGVVRRVVRLEERPHVVERRRVEVLEIAVEVVRVVPVLVRRHRQVDPREPAVGLIQDVDLDLVLHDLLLVLQILGIDVQTAHAIALGPQDGLEHVRRHDLEVVREVEPRGAVQEPAVRFDEANELHLAKVLRSLEHHVLEEVREPRLVLRLVAEADVVVQRDHHRRRRGVARQDDLEPILQLEVVSRNRELAGGRRRLCRDPKGRGSRYAVQSEQRGGGYPDCHGSYLHRYTPLEHLKHRGQKV